MFQNSLIWSKENTPIELHPLLETLSMDYPISHVNGEYELSFSKINTKGKSICKINDQKIEISYNTVSNAARAVGGAFAGIESDENIEFKTFGIMLDCSRNAVITVNHFKSWLRQLALMGYNMAMLYTEDTYQLPGEPFFGYKRGPYSLEEIKEIDAYANSVGIEMIACIQTLGHMEKILQWNVYDKVKDTATVLMVDEEESYKLIDKMLAFWSEGLSSNRIHIGMDETHDLGRGNFLDNFGYEHGFDIFNRHFAKVETMCKEYGLHSMIWSDMYFRMTNKTQTYYDLKSKIPQEIIEKIPKNSDLVYWDYYHNDKQFYLDFIERHRQLGYEPLMASGLWTWGRLWNDHDQNNKTVKPCLMACREAKLNEVFFTLWGDSGAYCEINSVLVDLCWAADLAYGGNKDSEQLEAQFKSICGGSYKNHMIASKLSAHILDGNEGLETIGSPFLLWDDPLHGICWESKKSLDPEFDTKAINLYDSIKSELAEQRNDNVAADINLAWLYADYLSRKVAFFRDLKNAYKASDKTTLFELAENTLPEMFTSLENVNGSIRKMWHKYFKPSGLEVLQIRQGGQAIRLKEAQCRIREYLAGTIGAIPELETETPQRLNDNVYCQIATPSIGI